MILILLFMLLLAGEKVNAQPTQTNRRAEEKQTNSQPSVTPLDNSQAQIDNPANAASPSQNQERDTKDDPFKVEQLRQNRIIAKATVYIAVFGGLSFLAALIYAIVSIKQWKAIDKQATHAGEQVGKMDESLTETRKLVIQNERAVKAAEDGVEIGQRAYVLIPSAKPEFNSDRHIMVEFEIKNYGNTPANYVQVSYRLEVLESDPESLNETIIDWESPRSSIIAPHSPHPVPYRIQLNISPEQRRAYNVKEFRLYFWGIIRYRDIFGKVHHTRFRRVHFPGQGAQFGDCKGGNEAD
jgi:hypothetical protein